MSSDKNKGTVLRILKILGIAFGAILLLVAGFFAYIALTEFKPEDIEIIFLIVSSAPLHPTDLNLPVRVARF